MRLLKKGLGAFMACVMMTTAIIAPDITVKAEDLASHGVDRTRFVQEDQLKEGIPSDFAIDQTIQGKPKDGVYTKYFLKNDIQTIKISVDENNLDYLLQNAIMKPTVMTDSVTIAGETVKYAGLKTKGSGTLDRTNNESFSDRFSFSINFGKYAKVTDSQGETTKQNFHGCKKISLNNFFYDKTMLKEYNALRLMTEMGLPTPAYGIAKLYINDKYYGVYAMVESMDDPIVKRYYGSGKISDYLVKPVDTTLAYDSSNDKYMDDNSASGTFFTLDSLKSKGALTYDETTGKYKAADEYYPWLSDTWNEESEQWENSGQTWNETPGLWEYDDDTLQDVAESLPMVLTWQKKLTLLSEGKNFSGDAIDVNSEEYLKLLDEVMDVDEVLRYFATHSFIIQMDNMFVNYQNYGLYIHTDGKSLMIPWDYDLGWGCYCFPYTAEDVANFGLDKLYTSQAGIGEHLVGLTDEQVYKQFPIFYVIYQNKTLMEKYHTYMEDCAKIATLGGTTSDERTFEAGRFAATMDELQSKVSTAAAESLYDSSKVYYLNDISQPTGVNLGIPNLKKVVALRSVGVWLKMHNINTQITGYGCDMDTLGNAGTGRFSTGGELITVNADTGIFAAATYEGTTASNTRGQGGGPGGNRGGFGAGNTEVGPSLSVTVANESDSDFSAIKGKINGDFSVYKMTNTKPPTTAYTLYIPVSVSWSRPKFYNYSGGVLTELSATKEDGNIYKTSTSDISTIVVTNGSEIKAEETAEQSVSADNGNTSSDASKSTVKKPSATKIKSLKNTGKRKLTVKWKKVSAATGYVIQYSTNKNFKKSATKKVTIKKKATVKKVIKKLKKGKKYYVRIRVYKTVSGKKYYSKWCTKKSVKIKK